MPCGCRSPRDYIALVVECNVDGRSVLGSLASPDPVFVFDQTGNVGVPGFLDVGFCLGLGKAVRTGGRRSRIVRVGVCHCGGAGTGICRGPGGLSKCANRESRARHDRDHGRIQKTFHYSFYLVCIFTQQRNKSSAWLVPRNRQFESSSSYGHFSIIDGIDELVKWYRKIEPTYFFSRRSTK